MTNEHCFSGVFLLDNLLSLVLTVPGILIMNYSHTSYDESFIPNESHHFRTKAYFRRVSRKSTNHAHNESHISAQHTR